tara:strand:+ start:347 stop:598 length:252 start_codon:yes stop_codon:yes gene_type:complete
MLSKKCKNHVKKSGTTTIGHFKFAIYASVLLFYAAIASLIHALMPRFFESTAARIVAKLYNERLKDHPNPEYRKLLDEKNSKN